MRALLLTFASLAAASTAGASSLERVVSGEKINHSITQLSCGQCPALIVAKKTGYIVPEIAAGTERVELKEINGEMKMVRTEAWLGGSPVVFISKASDDDIKEAHAKMTLSGDLAKTATAEILPVEAEATATPVMIDSAAKTSSLSVASLSGMAAVTPQDRRSQEVDLENFQLRLK